MNVFTGKIGVHFPAHVNAKAPATIEQVNGGYTFGIDVNQLMFMLDSSAVAGPATGNDREVVVWDGSFTNELTQKTLVGTPVKVSPTGEMLFAGGITGPNPLPRINLGDYVDTVPPTTSSHILLWSPGGAGAPGTQAGFGISVAQLNYVAQGGITHNFYCGTYDTISMRVSTPTDVAGTVQVSGTVNVTGGLIVGASAGNPSTPEVLKLISKDAGGGVYHLFQRDSVGAEIDLALVGGGATSAFGSIVVAGQGTVVADAAPDTLTLVAGANVTITTDATTDTITIAAASGAATNAFGTITVAGQSNVVADAAPDTLTLVAGTNVTIITDAATDTITISATAGGAGVDLAANYPWTGTHSWTQPLSAPAFLANGPVVSLAGTTGRVQTVTTGSFSSETHFRTGTDNLYPSLIFAKTRGATPTAHSALILNDIMAGVDVEGSNGTEYVWGGGWYFYADAAPIAAGVPSRFEVWTVDAAGGGAAQLTVKPTSVDLTVPLTVNTIQSTSNLNLRGTGTGNIIFANQLGQPFASIAPAAASGPFNYLQIVGATAGNPPYIAAQGADANISMTLNLKGTASALVVAIGGVGNILIADNTKVTVPQTTASTSSTTGALTVAGGVGISGALYVGSTPFIVGPAGAVLVSQTAASSSPTSGALVVNGGVGIGGALNIGGDLTSTKTGTLNFNLNATGQIFQNYTSAGGLNWLFKDNSAGGDLKYLNVVSGGGVTQWRTLLDAGGTKDTFQILDHSNGQMQFPKNIGSTSPTSGAVLYGGGVGVAGEVHAAGLIAHSAGLGYGVGAGSSVTQLTSKATAVTLSKLVGRIITAADSLAAGASVQFTLTNTLVGANDIVIASVSSANNYQVQIANGGGSSFCAVNLRNATAGALAEAVHIFFAVIKGSIS
jgi:hypothetical protein